MQTLDVLSRFYLSLFVGFLISFFKLSHTASGYEKRC